MVSAERLLLFLELKVMILLTKI